MIIVVAITADGVSQGQIPSVWWFVTLPYLLRIVERETLRDLGDGIVHGGEAR